MLYSFSDRLILKIYKLYYKYVLYIRSVHDIRLKTSLLGMTLSYKIGGPYQTRLADHNHWRSKSSAFVFSARWVVLRDPPFHLCSRNALDLDRQ